MAQSAKTVELSNDHREALAWALFEHHAREGTVQINQDLNFFRVECNDRLKRQTALSSPAIMNLYIQARGFDPRNEHNAPQIRWL